MTGRVTARDVLDAGYCVKGLRSVLDQHGRDLREFVREGIPIKDLENFDDAIIQRVVAQARLRVSAGDTRERGT